MISIIHDTDRESEAQKEALLLSMADPAILTFQSIVPTLNFKFFQLLFNFFGSQF